LGFPYLVIDNPWASLIKGANDSWATFIKYGHNLLGFLHYVLVTLGLNSLNVDKALELSSFKGW